MSIRVRLIVALVVGTACVWLSAALWIQNSTRGKVEQVLDARLAESAHMVSSLLTNRQIEVADAEDGIAQTFPIEPSYSQQLSCQIWTLSGALIGQSSGAPTERLTETEDPGYTYSEIDGQRWRVYSIVNERIGARIMVGDSVAVRDRLIRNVIEGFILPAAIVLPILALLIFFSVTRGLRPLDRLAQNLRERQSTDLSPLPAGPTPTEIRPVRTALNALFERVARTRQTERDFVAFAAHELKTPLAGLKTQAQIARIAPDHERRTSALTEIETSITRSDRLVRQLLELAAVEGESFSTQSVELRGVIKDVTAELSHLAEARIVTLSLAIESVKEIYLPRLLLHAAVRNVVENAILATPKGATVVVYAECGTQNCRIFVKDEGAGIPDDIRNNATDRFVRGRTSDGSGSGLGLSIVLAAMERMGGRVDFPIVSKGQTVCLTIPKASAPA